MVNLGGCYVLIGQYERALPILEQASQLAKALGARRLLAYVLMNFADAYLSIGDLQNAYHFAELAMQEMTPSQDTRGKVLLLDDFGMVSLAMGDEQAAFNYFREARDLALSQDLIPIAYETESGLAACLPSTSGP